MAVCLLHASKMCWCDIQRSSCPHRWSPYPASSRLMVEVLHSRPVKFCVPRAVCLLHMNAIAAVLLYSCVRLHRW